MEAHFHGLPDNYKPAMMRIKGKQCKCLDCGKISQKESHMREHIEGHVPGLQHICPKCGSGFKSKGSMRKHHIIINQFDRFIKETANNLR